MLALALNVAASNAVALRKLLDSGSKLSRAAVSAVERGRLAVDEVLDVAARALQLHVLDTSNEAHAADGQIPRCVQGVCGRIGLEVKDYGAPVPSGEVAKFEQDLNRNGFAAGVFVSLRSPISGVSRGVVLQRRVVERGPTWLVFVSPVASVRDLVQAGLAAAVQLTDEELASAASPTAVHRKRTADATPVIQDVKRRLREDRERHCSLTDKTCDMLTALQARLACDDTDLPECSVSDSPHMAAAPLQTAASEARLPSPLPTA